MSLTLGERHDLLQLVLTAAVLRAEVEYTVFFLNDEDGLALGYELQTMVTFVFLDMRLKCHVYLP
jgi:hypothetical protein